MLLYGPPAIESFSADHDALEEPSRDGNRAIRQTSRLQLRTVAESGAAGIGSTASATMMQGDQVVFERLDLAEALGIWRHARGRVVGIHGPGRGVETIDVKFEGHETLQRYLPDLFRRVH